MAKMVILRGISGSGKSTAARQMVKEASDKGLRSVICSADDYFVRQGGYKFDPRLLPEAHAWCRGKAVGAIAAGADLVLVDNTNLCLWEFKPYIEMAEEYGIECERVVVGEFDDAAVEAYAARNQHSVPIEKIKKMAEKFQKE